MDLIRELESKTIDKILTKNLTRREVEILSLYASGSTFKEISKILTISVRTAQNHINNIFSKIDLEKTASRKTTLCLFYSLFRKEITKMGGFKNAK